MKTKKEINDEYKQLKFKMGVYQIRNTVNGKIYIGSSRDLDAIWNRRHSELKFGGSSIRGLQKDWNELGEDKFVYEILAEIEHRDEPNVNYHKEIKELEKMYLEELQPYGEKGYN
jgi:group I intron endonuclease